MSVPELVHCPLLWPTQVGHLKTFYTIQKHNFPNEKITFLSKEKNSYTCLKMSNFLYMSEKLVFILMREN